MYARKPADHNKIINKAAKEVLTGLGCLQKGRSRMWYDDHGWWVTIIEFQPSGFGRGSYLNVGVMWLWVEKDYWSFDEGYRVENFIEYINDSQFYIDATYLAKRAAEEVLRYRSNFASVKGVADYLKKKKVTIYTSSWQLFHTGIACELAGYHGDAYIYFKELIDRLLHPAPEADMRWVNEFLLRAQELNSKLGDSGGFRAKIDQIIHKSRSLHKLAPIPDPFELK